MVYWIMFLFVPFAAVAGFGLMRLFLAPLFDAVKWTEPISTQYYISDALLFLLMFGSLSSVLVAMRPDQDLLLMVIGGLFLVLALMCLAGCYMLSRMQVRTFWPRAVGLTCVCSALISALGLAITIAPAFMVALHESLMPLAIWLTGFVLSLVLSRLGVKYVLEHAVLRDRVE